MVVFLRAKRVTDPLDDKAKARLQGDDGHRVTEYASSGSEHETAAPCLAGLVHAFLEDPGADSPSAADCCAAHPHDSSDDDSDHRDRAAAAIAGELMDPAAQGDRFLVRPAADVSAAVEGLAGLRTSCAAAALRRAVMARLRASGYNAGICKARWEASGGLNAGSYEHIDVVVTAAEGAGRRFIVDLEFAVEFEVARATEEYKRVVASLPRMAVAGEEAMRQVVWVVADAARRSLRARDLHVPPWRKSRYMIVKWLYRRHVRSRPMSIQNLILLMGQAFFELSTRHLPNPPRILSPLCLRAKGREKYEKVIELECIHGRRAS